MAHACIVRRLTALAVAAALCLALVGQADAIFDQEDPAEEPGRPIAQDLTLTTYRDVAVTGALSALDPEGDPVTFRVTKNPARGSLSFDEAGDGTFTYTPYENKTGKDSFTYVAEDAQGNVSQPAKVSIRIQKPATSVTYADLSGHPAQKAAIALAEKEVFVGEQLGDTWFFRPDSPVTREEFLTMAMKAVGMESLPTALATGFCDDEAISAWANPYVASALKAGMLQGSQVTAAGTSFDPARTITQTEAAVLLNRLLRVSDVAARGNLAEDAAPAWAYQSVVNLEAVGVLSAQADGTVALSDTLTRGEAAQMLLSAQEVLDFRAVNW
jgi:hypothetical protein